MNRFSCVLLVAILLLNLSCKDNPSGPGEPLNNFSFTVAVQDTTGHPVQGLQVKVMFRDDNAIGGWSIPYFWRIVFQASDSSGHTIYVQQTKTVDFNPYLLPGYDIFGYTSNTGSYTCTDSLRFPIALTQLDNDIISVTDSNPAELGIISLSRMDSIRITLRDTLTGNEAIHYELMTRGKNAYHYTWHPAAGYSNPSFTGSHSGKANPNSIPATWNSIIFKDHAGATQTLYYGPPDSTFNLGPYELPPLPPGEIFDVRFDTQFFVQLASYADTVEVPIDVQSSAAGYPLQITWSARSPLSVYGYLKYGDQKQVLIGSGTLTISSRSSAISLLLLAPFSTSGIPKSWNVSNPYPNPANSTSRIICSVPIPAHVKLNVLNLRGEKVSTLMDALKNAGYYTVDVNPQNFPMDKCY